MHPTTWGVLLASLWDGDGVTGDVLPGQSLHEWVRLVQYDYDWIDRDIYIEAETEGGG